MNSYQRATTQLYILASLNNPMRRPSIKKSVPYYTLINVHKIELSKYLAYPNNFRIKFTVSDHCGILQRAEGKKLVHQVVSHCSSNKASLNRQLVLSGLFLVSAGAIYCRTKVRRNFKLLCTYLSKSPDTEKLLKWQRCDVIC